MYHSTYRNWLSKYFYSINNEAIQRANPIVSPFFYLPYTHLTEVSAQKTQTPIVAKQIIKQKGIFIQAIPFCGICIFIKFKNEIAK